MDFANTTVHLCAGIPWDSAYNHVRLFANVGERITYLQGKIVKSFLGGTYQRETGAVRFPAYKDTIEHCNYLYYYNKDSIRWHFAFITRIVFVNQNATDIYFDTDIFATWFTPAAIKQSFVVREHVAQDTYGKYRLDEGFATGDYTEDFGITHGGHNNLTPAIVMAVSETDFLDVPKPSGTYHYFDNAFTGLNFYTSINASNIINMVDKYQKAGKAGAIVSIFMFPSEALSVDTNGWVTGTISTGSYNLWGGVSGYDSGDIDGYTPKNKKCYQYPFRILNVYADGSQEKSYKYENFFGNTVGQFYTITSLSPGAPLIAYPRNYNGTTGCTDEYITLSGWPICGWVTDTYANWLAQNQRTQEFKLIDQGLNKIRNGKVGIIGGGTPGVFGDVADAIMDAGTRISGGLEVLAYGKSVIEKTLQYKIEDAQHQVIPDSANGSIGIASAFYSAGKYTFHLWPKCARAEWVKKADEFFTMFGYTVNELKTPNLNTRPYWNYIQVSDANIVSNIPVHARNVIKAALEKGVTFWHTDDMYNYNLDNSPS